MNQQQSKNYYKLIATLVVLLGCVIPFYYLDKLPDYFVKQSSKVFVKENDILLLQESSTNQTSFIFFDKPTFLRKHPDESGYPIKEEFTNISELLVVNIAFGSDFNGESFDLNNASIGLLMNDTKFSYFDINEDNHLDFGIKIMKYENQTIYFEIGELSIRRITSDEWTIFIIVIIIINLGFLIYFMRQIIKENLTKEEENERHKTIN